METQIKKLMSAVSTLIALQIVTLVAVVGTTWHLYTDLKQHVTSVGAGSGRPNIPETAADWDTYVREHNAFQGREDAEVVLVEFTDFQCPYCRRYSEETRPGIVSRYADHVRMVFKHFPLEQIHSQAMTAAIAAQCAQREGKFWEIQERFFSQPDALDVDSVISIGESLGLSSSYADCVVNEETKAEVEQDIEDALEVGVQATPTFMINGKFLVGAQSEVAFRSAFEEAGLAID